MVPPALALGFEPPVPGWNIPVVVDIAVYRRGTKYMRARKWLSTKKSHFAPRKAIYFDIRFNKDMSL
jgi:hypothetical protein